MPRPDPIHEECHRLLVGAEHRLRDRITAPLQQLKVALEEHYPEGIMFLGMGEDHLLEELRTKPNTLEVAKIYLGINDVLASITKARNNLDAVQRRSGMYQPAQRQKLAANLLELVAKPRSGEPREGGLHASVSEALEQIRAAARESVTDIQAIELPRARTGACVGA